MEVVEGKIFNIDKINCIIEKNVIEEPKVYNTKAVPKVIYKPIFYRTYDLQSIKLRMGLSQNIGINLSEYMTKVEGFKLSIEGKESIESARNDIYIIFKVDTTILSVPSGTYHILDQDGEYISSGEYELMTT